MNARLPSTVSLGELVVMTFDAARRFETDPREVSRRNDRDRA